MAIAVSTWLSGSDSVIPVPGESEPPRYSLETLRHHLDRSTDLQIASAEVDAQRHALAQSEALDGIKFFGSVGVGRYKDLVDEDSVWYHSGGRFLGGLSYPLLGSREELERAKLKASATLEEKRLLEEAARRRALSALRLHYIGYWEAVKSAELSRAFLGLKEGVMRQMRQRSDARIQLLSETLDVDAEFAKASQNLEQSEAVKERELGALRLATGLKLVPFYPYTPALALPLYKTHDFYARVLSDLPVVKVWETRLKESMTARDLDRYRGVESDLRLSGFVNPEFTTSRQGDGVELSFNIRLPLSWQKVIDEQKGLDAARTRKTLLSLKKASGEALVRIRYEVRQLQAARRSLDFARKRMAAALEYWREQRLGLGHLSRVTPVTLQNARYRYYLTALEYVQAYARRERAKAILLGELPEEKGLAVCTACDFGENPATPFIEEKKALVAHRTPKTAGFYLWRSGELLAHPDKEKAFFEACRRWGIDRILFALNANQLKKIEEANATQIARFLEKAHRQGIGVEALLGEPTWLLPERRADLLRRLPSLASMPFEAVHLDIEPDQLDTNLTHRQKVRWLLETLTAAVEASPLPVGVSLHPRYLADSAENGDMGSLLKHLGLYDVAVMLYALPPEKATLRYRELLKRYPGMPLTLAVSVEKSLFPKALKGVGKEDLNRWKRAVSDMNGSLLIQDYTHWRRMEP